MLQLPKRGSVSEEVLQKVHFLLIMDTEAFLPLKVSYCRKREHVQRLMRQCACLLSLHVLGYGIWKDKSRINRRKYRLSRTVMTTVSDHYPIFPSSTTCFTWDKSIKMKPFKKWQQEQPHHYAGVFMLGFQSPGRSSWGLFKQQSTPLSPADPSTIQLLPRHPPHGLYYTIFHKSLQPFFFSYIGS